MFRLFVEIKTILRLPRWYLFIQMCHIFYPSKLHCRVPAAIMRNHKSSTINLHAVLAAKEGGMCQTGFVRLTALMNIRGSIHHKTFTTIPATIQRKLYGITAETLAISHHAIHQVYEEMYGPCQEPCQLAVSYSGTWKKHGFVIDTLTALCYRSTASSVSWSRSSASSVSWSRSSASSVSWSRSSASSVSWSRSSRVGKSGDRTVKVMCGRPIELLNSSVYILTWRW